MSNQLRSLCAVFLMFATVFLLVGCASTPKMAPRADFLSGKGSIGVVWIGESADPRGGFYKEGDQGLLDIAISGGLASGSDVVKKMNEVELEPLVKKHYADPFTSAFTKEGFAVKTIRKCYLRTNLPKFAREKGEKGEQLKERREQFAELDYTSIAKELGVDNLCVLNVRCFGISRSFYGFIPTGPARGYSQLSVLLVEGKSNRLVGQYPLTAMTKNCEGNWNQPPEFTDLMKAVERSLEDTVDESFVLFFNRTP